MSVGTRWIYLAIQSTMTSEIQSLTKTKENAFLSYFVNTDGKLQSWLALGSVFLIIDLHLQNFWVKLDAYWVLKN